MPERWSEIKALFQQCLDLEPAARDALLDPVRQEDPELCARVVGLLAAHDQADDFLVAPAVQDAIVGRRFGRYRLIEEIGRGGMAAVYRAQRDDDFRHQVAVKLLVPGMASEEIVRRFRNERQILAGLSHPHIAHLLDGGRGPEGQPFLVMEYVDGEPIDDYCDNRRLSLRERLRLVIQVCSAVDLAHGSGVIHRDLKPANILVTDDGIPKLLDFGIAKIIDPDMASTLAATATGARWMTPSHASPEQVRGEEITAATDVYALGVLLYGLVTGTAPYAISESTDLVQAILTERPLAASRAVSQHRDATAIAAARRTRPRQLVRQIRGDLDTVILKALSKSPRRRYASARALAEDLERYLAAVPLAARPDSALYRARQWVRRYPAATIAMVLAAAWALTMSWQWQLIRLERDHVTRERASAEAALEFLVGVFESTAPGPDSVEQTAARQIIDRAAARLATDDVQPDLQTKLHQTLGRVYYLVGAYDRAQPLLEKALAQQPPPTVETAREYAGLTSQLAELRFSQEQLADAAALHLQALEMRRDIGDEVGVASSLNDLAMIDLASGDLERADERLADALARQLRLFGRHSPEVAATLNHRAEVLRRRGDIAGAIVAARESVEIFDETVWEGSRSRLTARANLARFLFEAGDYEAAELLLRASAADYAEHLGPLHPEQVSVLTSLATVQRHRGHLDEAEQLQRRALEISRVSLGEEHGDTLKVFLGLATVHTARGDLDGAEAAFRELLELHRRQPTSKPRDYASTLNNLAMLLGDKGHFDEAIELMGEAVAVRSDFFGPRHSAVADTLNNQGFLVYLKGDLAAAEELFRRSLEVSTATRPVGHPYLAFPLLGLARVALDRRQSRAALEHVERALEIRRVTLPEGHWRIAEAEALLGECYLQLGQQTEARTVLRSSLDVLEGVETGSAKRAFTRARRVLGRFAS